jgi:hypothetical protein
MRPLVASFLLFLQLAPSLAVGLCASGLAGGPEEVDCPMSHRGSASRGGPPAVTQLAAPGLTVDAQPRAHCCDATDLCMFSAPTILSARLRGPVLPLSYQVQLVWSTTALAREPTAPPSPPPNA